MQKSKKIQIETELSIDLIVQYSIEKGGIVGTHPDGDFDYHPDMINIESIKLTNLKTGTPIDCDILDAFSKEEIEILKSQIEDQINP